MSDSRNNPEGISAFVRASTEEEAVKSARRVHQSRAIPVGKVLYIEDFGDGEFEVVLQRLHHSRVVPQYASAGTSAPVLVGYKQVPL